MDFIFDSEILNQKWTIQARDLNEAWEKLYEYEPVYQNHATYRYNEELSNKLNEGEIKLSDVLQIS